MENVVLNTYVLCYLLFCINAAIIEVEMRLAEGADLTPHHHYIILSHPITSKIYSHLPPFPPVLSDQQKQRWLILNSEKPSEPVFALFVLCCSRNLTVKHCSLNGWESVFSAGVINVLA